MGRGNAGVVRARVVKLSARGKGRERADWIAAESPLEVHIGGKPATVLLRTPGEDDELVRGLLFAEGVIDRAADIAAIRPLPRPAGRLRGDRIAVRLAHPLKGRSIERALYSSSACGACGKQTLASLAGRAGRIRPGLRVPRKVLGSLPARMRSAQAAFRQTGGIHAAALFAPGGKLAGLREDVGRHNALDKLIGWALGKGMIPLSGHVLLVSGRVSYEIVQKAAAASIPLVAAVGAPSSLAVDLARESGLTLVGFLRPGSMNVYTCRERIDA